MYLCERRTHCFNVHYIHKQAKGIFVAVYMELLEFMAELLGPFYVKKLCSQVIPNQQIMTFPCTQMYVIPVKFCKKLLHLLK